MRRLRTVIHQADIVTRLVCSGNGEGHVVLARVCRLEIRERMVVRRETSTEFGIGVVIIEIAVHGNRVHILVPGISHMDMQVVLVTHVVARCVGQAERRVTDSPDGIGVVIVIVVRHYMRRIHFHHDRVLETLAHLTRFLVIILLLGLEKRIDFLGRLVFGGRPVQLGFHTHIMQGLLVVNDSRTRSVYLHIVETAAETVAALLQTHTERNRPAYAVRCQVKSERMRRRRELAAHGRTYRTRPAGHSLRSSRFGCKRTVETVKRVVR